MINKKIALSSLSILTSLALMAGATFAYFNDAGSSSNNTFSSGTFDLQLKDTDQGFQDNVSASFTTPANWAPGDTHISYLCFKNNGSTPIQQILFDLNSDNAGDTGNDLDQYIFVSNIELGDVTGNPAACDEVGIVGSEGLTNFITLFNSRFGTETPLSTLLAEIDGANKTNDDLLDGEVNLMEQNDLYKLRVEWTFDQDAPATNVAGKTVDLDLNFTATQNEES